MTGVQTCALPICGGGPRKVSEIDGGSGNRDTFGFFFAASLRFRTEPVESKPVSPALAETGGAGWIAEGCVRVVGSGAVPKRCVLRGSVRLGLNGSASNCAAASPANAVASATDAPSRKARVVQRPRGRARLRQPQCEIGRAHV